MATCLVPTELDTSAEIEALEESLEELREMQEEEANSVFIPEDVVFDVIVVECADFEEESFH